MGLKFKPSVQVAFNGHASLTVLLVYAHRSLQRTIEQSSDKYDSAFAVFCQLQIVYERNGDMPVGFFDGFSFLWRRRPG
jgi:hypothetical protein